MPLDAPGEISTACERGRHEHCRRPLACDCECHDDQGATPVPKRDDGRFDCEDPECDRDFPTEQGARVHYSRTHGANADARPKVVTHSLGPSRVVDEQTTATSKGSFGFTIPLPVTDEVADELGAALTRILKALS